MQHFIQRLFILALVFLPHPSLFAAQATIRLHSSEQEIKEKHDSAIEKELGANYQAIIGLDNSDNRCFLNACLQAILHSSPFREHVHKNQYPDDSFGKTLKDFSQKYAELAYSDAYENAESTDSSEVKNALIKLYEDGFFNLDLSTNRQEDAAEVLAKILEKATLNPAHPATNSFCIQEVAQFQCMLCKDTYEKEHDEYKYGTIISLPIQKDTLDACLWDYFYGPVEKHCDCQNPFQNCTFTKKVMLKQAPAMLCIAFNRFTETFHGPVKEFKNVSFPAENLDMRAFTEQEDQTAIYDLVACVVHTGLDLHSGHYKAYVKKDSLWYICDDAKIFVSAANFYNAFSNQVPYLLFYKKREQASTDILKKAPRIDKKPKASPASQQSLAQQLNGFFFSTPQRSILSLGFFVGVFIVINRPYAVAERSDLA